MSVFVCEAPGHEGDRRVQHPSDQCVVSLDIMRKDSTVRIYRIRATDLRRLGIEIPERLCRMCANAMEARARRDEHEQEAML